MKPEMSSAPVPEGEMPRSRLSPTDFVGLAIEKIQPDGSVLAFDEKEQEWFLFDPVEAVDVTAMPVDNRRSLVWALAHAIISGLSGAGRSKGRMEREAEELATSFAAYRNHPDILHQAASLIDIHEDGSPGCARPPAYETF